MTALKPLALAAWAAGCLCVIGPVAWAKFPEALDAFRGPVQLGPYAGMFWAQTLRAALLVTLAWLSTGAVGATALAWLKPPRTMGARERTPATLVLGVGLAACGSLALALCGLWCRPVFAGLLPMGALAGARALRHGGRAPAFSGPETDAVWLRRGCLGLGLLLGVFSLSPETWTDSLYYHLNAPSDFADAHKWVDRDEAVFRYPLLAESLFGPLMLLGGERAAVLVNVSGFLLLAWVLRAATERLAGATAGWLAALSILLSDQIGFHIGHTNQGFYSCLFAFFAVDIWTRAALSSGSKRSLLLAGACLSWAMCSKYTAIAPAAGILAWHAVRAFRRPRRELAALALLAAGFAATGTVFLVKGWLLTRNPVYPIVFGGLDWTPASDLLMKAYGCPGTDFDLADPRSVGHALLGFLSVQRPLGLFALPAIALLPLRPLLPFLAAWSGAVAVWATMAPCFRFMLPAFPALALLAAIGLTRWINAARPVGLVARAAIALIAVHGAIQALAGADFHKRSFNASVGLETDVSYFDRNLTSYWRAVQAVNRIVPAGGRVLASGEARGYRFRPLVFNRGGPEDFPQILSLVRKSRTIEDIRKRLRRRGARFLLLNYVTEEFRASFSISVIAWRPEEIRRWWAFWRVYGHPVWMETHPDPVNGGFVLYEISRRPLTPPAVMAFLPGAALAALRRPDEDGQAHAARLADLQRAAPGVAFFNERRAKAVLESGGPPALALAAVEEAFRCEYPEPAKLHGLTGMAYARMRRYREAAAAFGRARALDPAEPLYAQWESALR